MHGGGGCGSRQRQVANGADVVFTDIRVCVFCIVSKFREHTNFAVLTYLLSARQPHCVIVIQ